MTPDNVPIHNDEIERLADPLKKDQSVLLEKENIYQEGPKEKQVSNTKNDIKTIEDAEKEVEKILKQLEEAL
jgi:hypothetical protein